MAYKPKLKEKYNKEIVKSLKDKMKYKSIMQVPKLQKKKIMPSLPIEF